MKHILITTIAAVLLVGCGPSVDIWEATEMGDIATVKQHLAAGTDVNAKDEDSWTPLHFAAASGHKEIAELLIDKGADVNAKEVDGETSLHYADTKEIAVLLIAEGADVNAKNDAGFTPLHHAAVFGRKEIAELLIAEGADVNAKEDEYGITPLHEAAFVGYKEIAELLIAKGGDVNAKDVDGGTPLDAAQSVNEDVPPEDKAANKEIADLLREHGGKTGAELKAEGK